MPLINIPLSVLMIRLENELTYSKVIRWEELDALENKVHRILGTLGSRTNELCAHGFVRYFSEIESIGPIALSKRIVPETVEHRRLSLRFEPPHENVRWKKPFEITFDAVLWPSGNFWTVSVPILDIELSIKEPSEFAEKTESRIRDVLKIRYGNKFGLDQLLEFGNVQNSELKTYNIEIKLPNLQECVRKEFNRASEIEEAEQWDRIGIVFLKRNELQRAFGLGEYLERIREEFFGPLPRPILLVGPSGVGKTALWREYVRRSLSGAYDNSEKSLFPSRSKYGETDGPSIVAAAVDAGSDWQEYSNQLIEIAEKNDVILYLGNLWELNQVGTSISRTQSLGSYMIPLAAGRFPFVCECTPEQLSVLEQEQPGILFPFLRIELEEPDSERAIKIYEKVAKRDYIIGIEPDAVRKLDALHRRYATYSAFPGRAIRFLRSVMEERQSLLETSLKNDAKNLLSDTITVRDIIDAFSSETGLPDLILDDTAPFDKEEARKWFSQRIIGQGENASETGKNDAISIILDLLGTYKARLSRGDRPIASLLFVGPSGVGKTEMAKALAKFLYDDSKRMIRIDMSEYAEYGSAERLIRGNASGEGILSAKIRHRPFSVVLLDEFEKAHPEVFDLLLQVLGEGRLSDAGGRVADFRNSIIIMTSNLGVERFGMPKAGFENEGESKEPDTEKSVAHFTSEAARLLRPEMLNRIDRIVPFGSLSKDSLRKILDIQLQRMLSRNGLANRPVSIKILPEVRELLIEKGYEPRYGARPLKRALERELLVPLAKTLRKYPAKTRLEITLSLDSGKVAIETKVLEAPSRSIADDAIRTGRMNALSELRRKLRVLSEHRFFRDIHRRIKRYEKVLDKNRRRRLRNKTVLTDPKTNELISRVEKTDLPVLGELKELYSTVIAHEEKALIAYFKDVPGEKPIDASVVESRYRDLLGRIFETEEGDSNRIMLIVYGKSPSSLRAVLDMYENCARLMRFDTARYMLGFRGDTNRTYEKRNGDVLLYFSSDSNLCNGFRMREEPPSPFEIEKLGKSLQIVLARKYVEGDDLVLPGHTQFAHLIEINGKNAGHIFKDEFGKHRWLNFDGTRKQFECSLEVSEKELYEYFPRIDQRGNPKVSDPRIKRTIDFDKPKTESSSDGANDSESLKKLLEETFDQRMLEWFEE